MKRERGRGVPPMSDPVDYNAKGFGRSYAVSRELPTETLKQWLDAIARWVPPGAKPVILDVGCGTGRFTEPLAHCFASTVIGLDPACEMLGKAKAQFVTTDVYQICGRAEALPVRDNSIDLAFLSMVYHHLADRSCALRELGRVLPAGGRLIIRNATRENIEKLEWIVHFPEARELELRWIPVRAEVAGELRCAGFGLCAQEAITQTFAATYSDYYRKISMRSLSSLLLISDAAFEAGRKRLKAWCEQRWERGPVRETIDLIVAGKV